MNSSLQTARIGLFFVLGLALVWVTYETLSGGHFFQKQGYTLIADFDDLKGLKVSDDVRVAGVRVGSVERTQLAGRKAEAVLRIRPDVKVPRDATAEIATTSLLGTQYVAISLGSPGSPPLANGSQIQTRETPDINTVMSELSDLGTRLNAALGSLSTSLSGPNGQGGLLQKLDQLVTQNQEKIGETMTNLRDITGKINSGQGTVGQLINSPALHDQLLATVAELKSTADEAKGMMGQAQSVLAQVRSGRGPIGVLLYDQQTADNLKATVRNVREVSDKIARGEGSLGKLLSDDSLYNSAESTLRRANRTLDTMNDTGPITAVGIVANSLF